MKKTEILEEIKKLALEINTNLKDLEREGYSESSFAYDRVEELRFDGYSYINKSGYFRISGKLSKKDLERELYQLKKLKNYSSISPAKIRAYNKQAFQTFNENIREWNKAHPNDKRSTFTQKQYARLKYMFKEMKDIGAIVSSDTVIELTRMTSKKEAESLMNYLTKTKKMEKELSKFMKDKQKDGSITVMDWIRGRTTDDKKQVKRARKR